MLNKGPIPIISIREGIKSNYIAPELSLYYIVKLKCRMELTFYGRVDDSNIVTLLNIRQKYPTLLIEMSQRTEVGIY